MQKFKRIIFILTMLAGFSPVSIMAGGAEHMIGILIQPKVIKENQPFRIIFAVTVDAADKAANLTFDDLSRIQQPFFSNFNIIDSVRPGYERNMNYVFTNSITTGHEELTTYYYSYILTPKTRGTSMIEPLIIRAHGENYESDILFRPILAGRISAQDSISQLNDLKKGFRISDLTQASSIDTILSKTYEVLDWYDVPFMIGCHRNKPNGISASPDTIFHVAAGHKFTVPYFISAAVNVNDMTSGQIDSVQMIGFKAPSGLIMHNEWIGSSISYRQNYKEYARNINIVFTAPQKGHYIINAFKMKVAGRKYKMPKVTVIVE